MSYSICIVSASLAAACATIGTELDAVVASQPIHAADRDQAEAAAIAFVNLLEEPGENEEVMVSVSGSVCRWTTDIGGFTDTGISVNAAIRQKVDRTE